MFEYYQRLIKMRKEHPVFRMESQQQINKNLQFLEVSEENVIAYQLQGTPMNDSWHKVLVIFNAEESDINFSLPQGNWYSVLKGMEFMEKKEYAGITDVPAYSAMILVQD